MIESNLAEIYSKSWAVVEFLKKKNELQEEYSELVYNCYVSINKTPKFGNKVSLNDVSDFFEEILHRTRKPSVDEITPKDLEKALRKDILHDQRDYEFYYNMGRTAHFEPGFQIGVGRVYPSSKLPKEDRMFIEEHTKDRPKRKRNGSRLSETMAEDWFLHITVRTVGWHNALEKGEAILGRSLGVYELVSGSREFLQSFLPYSSSMDFYMICDEERSVYHERSDFQVPFYNLHGHEDALRNLSRIIGEETSSEIAERIIHAIDILAMIGASTPLDAKFLLKVIALEGLVLSDNDRDYLGWKLAEKMTFILGEDPQWVALAFNKIHPSVLTNITDWVDADFIRKNRSSSRRILNREVVRLYRLRSSFAHGRGNKSKHRVTEYDYLMVSVLLRLLIVKLAELLNRGITHLAKESVADRESLDNLIDHLKY